MMGSVPLAELEALYRCKYRRFLRVATAILHDETRAVDAVQEAFASALRLYDGNGGVVQRAAVLFKLRRP